jgi:hypothetical protein
LICKRQNALGGASIVTGYNIQHNVIKA